MANTLRTRFGYLPSLGQHQRANASHLRLHRPAERAPKPNPPSQPRPRTRRAYHLAHAKGRRIDRHQRPPARRSWRDVRRTRTLRAAVPGRMHYQKVTLEGTYFSKVKIV